MRNLAAIDEQLVHRVCEEAERRRWPALTVDFRDDGYMTSWGPGAIPWMMVLWRAEGDDLRLLLKVLSGMPVPILRGFEDAGEALAIAVERSARYWAEARDNAGRETEAYDAVLAVGAVTIVELLLKQFNLVPVMANAWKYEYNRQVANVNAKREQDGSKAVPSPPSRRS